MWIGGEGRQTRIGCRPGEPEGRGGVMTPPIHTNPLCVCSLKSYRQKEYIVVYLMRNQSVRVINMITDYEIIKILARQCVVLTQYLNHIILNTI